MSRAARAPDPGRPVARLVDGPYAGSALYVDALLANIAAARRYPPGHPAADFARYRPVDPAGYHTAEAFGPGAGDTDWRWCPLTAAEEELRSPARVRTPAWARDVDLSSSAAVGKAARDHTEWAAERAAERELRDAGIPVVEVTGW